MTQNDTREDQIIDLLAEYLGVSSDDLKLDDSLPDDLHMSASELTDFKEQLIGKGYDIENVNLGEIDTINDLIDAIGDSEI